ncbi:hypothetical protein [Variovorax sp. J31P207]|uniref:hypothetical protein n=1 Tax=Variovorax sp. J31P207 TaxID=3053510 RepID=UPI002577AC86|nr:hypothetical protein [Variovorax sp. J31P207]MDM0068792.1 hypothetical protein [Variovorax sp. J31P207]
MAKTLAFEARPTTSHSFAIERNAWWLPVAPEVQLLVSVSAVVFFETNVCSFAMLLL